MQSTNVQSTTGNLPVGKRHYGQRTSWQRPIGLNTTGKWMLGKMLRGQYDWQANYDRPNFYTIRLVTKPVTSLRYLSGFLCVTSPHLQLYAP